MQIKSHLSNLSTAVSSTKKNVAFQAASQAMAELFTAGCIGSACSRTGLLTKVMIQSLSKTTTQILLPMFLFTSIMKTMSKYGGNGGGSSSKLGSILFVPLVAIVHQAVMYSVSKFVILPLFQVDQDTDEGRATIVSW